MGPTSETAKTSVGSKKNSQSFLVVYWPFGNIQVGVSSWKHQFTRVPGEKERNSTKSPFKGASADALVQVTVQVEGHRHGSNLRTQRMATSASGTSIFKHSQANLVMILIDYS